MFFYRSQTLIHPVRSFVASIMLHCPLLSLKVFLCHSFHLSFITCYLNVDGPLVVLLLSSVLLAFVRHPLLVVKPCMYSFLYVYTSRAWQIALEEARTMATYAAHAGVPATATTIVTPPGYMYYNSPYVSYGYPGRVISHGSVIQAPPAQGQ